ncbi:penicillin-binding protein [Ruminococcaceae bacterium OttesenSCG-928-I18]|nr:penicillin-binding protein [Ruminococcaceae bacterium OttesenSCG-928-I18]
MKYSDFPQGSSKKQPGRSHGAQGHDAGAMARPRRRVTAGETHPIQPVEAPPVQYAKETPGDATRVIHKPRKQGGSQPPRGRKPSGAKTAKIVFLNLLKALLVLLCIGLIVLCIIGVQLAKYVAETTADDDVVLDLELLKLPQTGYILAQNPETGEWTEYQKLVRESNSIWVPLDRIPQQLVDAVVSTEDREFYEHNGVSFKRTAYAALNEVFQFQNTFGASTIDQQLVKNLTGEKEVVGEDGTMDAGYKRKTREIFRAWGLNNRYSKDMIMEAYLNTLPLSGTIVGVEAGAIEYFNKEVSELTLAESALIAGITQAPGKYNPFTNPDNALQRRNDVLYFMLENEKITQAEYDEAVGQPLGLNQGDVSAEQEETESEVTSYFTDAVFEEVVSDLVEQGICETREAAVDYYYTAGLRIESTVDLTLQAEMERVYELGWAEEGLFPEEVFTTTESGEEIHPQSAMAVVRYDGSLAGVVGGIGEKQESLGLNRATQSPRPIGSTMKPLAAYALGIDYDIIDYSSLVTDSYVLPEQNWPVNYGPTRPTGNSVLVCDAVAESLNTVPAHVGEWVGIEPMYDFLANTLEISTLVDEGSVNDMGLSPLVIGGMTQGVTAAELAAAYTMFGGDHGYGIHNTLHCYERVTDSRGNIVMEPEIATVQAISPESAYIMNRLLYNVLRSSGPVNGTASGMALTTTDSVGKTGTTTDDKDRWFVGLTPYYVSAVWWGYDQNELIEWSPRASTNPPPNVWHDIMEAVQAELPEKDFPEAPITVVERAFCRDSGLLASDGCGNRQTGYYAESSLPEVCQGNHVDPAAGGVACAADQAAA